MVVSVEQRRLEVRVENRINRFPNEAWVMWTESDGAAFLNLDPLLSHWTQEINNNLAVAPFIFILNLLTFKG